MRLRAHQWMIVLLVVGAILGVLVGLWVPPERFNVGFLGDIFLSSLKMLVVPLVMTTIIAAVGGMGDFRRLGRLGGYTFGYYFLTTGLSCLLGIFLVTTIQPGQGVAPSSEIVELVHAREAGVWPFVRDLLLRMVSPNLAGSIVEMDILAVIVFSIIFGAVLGTMGPRGKPLIDLTDALAEAILKFVQFILWFAPVGVFALIAARLQETGGGEGLRQLLTSVGKYSLTVIGGVVFHGVVVLPLLLALLARRNPWWFAGHFSPALIMAFSTSSSSATLPVTIECAEKRAGLSPRAAGSVLPLGATINMDGTALYEAVAAVFIAQVYGVPLSSVQLGVIFLTATLAAVGAAGIPQAGLTTMPMVLLSVGLPLEGVALIVPVDWFIDRFRTAVNVWGDCVGTGVVQRLVFDAARREEAVSPASPAHGPQPPG